MEKQYGKWEFSFDRPITSYRRLRRAYSTLVRNTPLQIHTATLREKLTSDRRLLNVGCGPNAMPEFVNLDYDWSPGVDVIWDIAHRFPFADATFDGVFSEHCLEHVSLETGARVIRELYRVTKPGGCVRIVVPDGELYMELYRRARDGEATSFPYASQVDLARGATAIEFVNRLFIGHGHRFIYDFETLQRALATAGFAPITRASFRTGAYAPILVDAEERAVESLYVDAVRPR